MIKKHIETIKGQVVKIWINNGRICATDFRTQLLKELSNVKPQQPPRILTHRSH